MLQVDELRLEVRRSGRRKTLEITVDRGGELVIAAPDGVSDETLAKFVREKRLWVYTKLAEKDLVFQRVLPKEYVSGEGFSYLGRSYRLLVVEDQEVPLKLEGGRFRLLRSAARRGREHFVSWYTGRGPSWLEPRVAGWATRMGVTTAGVEVRDLGYRWGSCSKSGMVNFHWATVLFPPTIVDYVIVHELAHLLETNHTPEFWQRVARALPEYAYRKAWLAEHGAKVAGI